MLDIPEDDRKHVEPVKEGDMKNAETGPKKYKPNNQPRLDTILMVEGFIKSHSGEYKRRSLWEHLPKRMMYQNFKKIIDYLRASGKIVLDRDGVVVWIWDPEMVRQYYDRDDLSIK